ncbi:hypothetical protein HMPREF9058_0841 [Actinomyces sp. oral taxon 175 str. F0384]|nr:hypothetical protein HMPREF9058_0841 [Actinomyces sp. oral taxon 175 str. F0384]
MRSCSLFVIGRSRLSAIRQITSSMAKITKKANHASDIASPFVNDEARAP